MLVIAVSLTVVVANLVRVAAVSGSNAFGESASSGLSGPRYAVRRWLHADLVCKMHSNNSNKDHQTMRITGKLPIL